MRQSADVLEINWHERKKKKLTIAKGPQSFSSALQSRGHNYYWKGDNERQCCCSTALDFVHRFLSILLLIEAAAWSLALISDLSASFSKLNWRD